MFIDHLSKITLSWWSNYIIAPLVDQGNITLANYQIVDNFIRFTLQGIGTIAFPLFCFLLSEGFHYTSNRYRYIGVMLVFAIISEIPFDISFFNRYSANEGTYPFYWKYQNVYFTLFLGLLTLLCIEKIKSKTQKLPEIIKTVSLKLIFIIGMAFISVIIQSDYNSQGILYITSFYICRRNRLYQILLFIILFIATTGNQPTIYTYITVLIILFYNGKRKKTRSKYFYYLFYPVHIMLLYLLTIVFEMLL